MNADTYRLVFNAHRGCPMAAAESARNCGKGRQTGRGRSCRRAHLSRDAAGFVGAREELVITAGGRLVGETDVALTARQIDHRGGQTQAAGTLTVRASESIDNAGG